MGYPTLKLYKAGEIEGIEYHGERDLQSLESYLRLQLGDSIVDGNDPNVISSRSSDEATSEEIDSPEIPKPVSGLYELDDENLEVFIKKGDFFSNVTRYWL